MDEIGRSAQGDWLQREKERESLNKDVEDVNNDVPNGCARSKATTSNGESPLHPPQLGPAIPP